MQYSLFDNEPARPAVPKYELPDCYTVHNIAPLGTKINNLNDEALMMMFYSNPGDLHQAMAAQELWVDALTIDANICTNFSYSHGRNWRYHKKLQLWLTKDEGMVPHNLGNGSERGYYIFFDINLWERQRVSTNKSHDALNKEKF